jgi:hypothetical protein
MATTNVVCDTFTIDIKNEYLRYFNIWYESTGVYTLQLETSNGKSAMYGPMSSRSSSTKQLWGLSVKENGPEFAFVGLAGTHRPDNSIGIGSLQTIVMNLNCTSTS